MAFDPTAAVHREYAVLPLPPDLIPSTSLHKQQILWIGCSDSWITETESLRVHPEEMFVHRNLGNVISNGDLSSTSALSYCIELLQVKHIVVCGHYDCGLIADDKGVNALHGWHSDLSRLHEAHEAYLHDAGNAMDEATRGRHLEEVWVLAEVDWLRKQEVVQHAIEQRDLQLHAFVFEKDTRTCVQLVAKSS